MIVCIKGEVEGDETPPQFVSAANNCLPDVLLPEGSPGSANISKNIVIVMDALRGFSWEPLQWVLDHVIQTGCTITLLGVMPWIPLPLSCKTWLDVWTCDLANLSALKESSEGKNDQKHKKIREIVELCEQKGVIPCMKVAMGHPLRLVVLEQTTSLHASCVVIDRHLRKNKAFFAERLPSSVIILNGEGGVDMLRKKSNMDTPEFTPGESPITLLPSPQLILSEEVYEIFRNKTDEQVEATITPD